MLIIGKNNYHKWRLLLKVLNEELSEDDDEFLCWLAEDVENHKLYQTLKGNIKEKNMMFDKDKMFDNLSDILGFESHKKVPLYKKSRFLYMASLLLAVSVGLAGYLFLRNNSFTKQVSESGSVKDIMEDGSKKALLLSSQGEAIDLSEAFEIKKNDGTVISNKDEGIISFAQNKPGKKKIEYHTLAVPKGGEYVLFLPDGSKVYLNSETQLVFPSYFEGDVRQVELIGEAYFEVKKDSKPFVVRTMDMQIRVLGTSFNINAYQDIESVNTTLVEGSIEVNVTNNTQTFRIEPKNNFSFNKTSNEVAIEKVNTDVYTAWMNGELVFRSQPLGAIFPKLKRWYNFSVVYEDPALKAMRFTGSVRKEKPLDYLLDQIQHVTSIKYRNEGNKIILY